MYFLLLLLLSTDFSGNAIFFFRITGTSASLSAVAALNSFSLPMLSLSSEGTYSSLLLPEKSWSDESFPLSICDTISANKQDYVWQKIVTMFIYWYNEPLGCQNNVIDMCTRDVHIPFLILSRMECGVFGGTSRSSIAWPFLFTTVSHFFRSWNVNNLVPANNSLSCKTGIHKF